MINVAGFVNQPLLIWFPCFVVVQLLIDKVKKKIKITHCCAFTTNTLIITLITLFTKRLAEIRHTILAIYL